MMRDSKVTPLSIDEELSSSFEPCLMFVRQTFLS